MADPFSRDTSGEHCPFPRPPTELSAWERLTLEGGSELERLLGWFAKKVTRFSVTQAALGNALQDLSAVGKYYQEELDRGRLAVFQTPREAAPGLPL